MSNKPLMWSDDWDKYFLNLSLHIATKSKDPNTKCGCVIVGPDKEIRSTGFNGFPRKVKELAERQKRPDKYSWNEHAERNAVFNAARFGAALDGCAAYITHPPCVDCGRALIQAGIRRAVWYGGRLGDQWKDSHAKALIMFEETGLSWTQKVLE